MSRSVVLVGLLLASLALCVGCPRSSSSNNGSDGAASAPPATSDASAAGSGTTITLARNLGVPSSLAVDSKYVYFADVTASTIARLPRAGTGATTTSEQIAKDQPFASNLVIVGDDLVWSTKLGVFRLSTKEKNAAVRTVRTGTFVGVAISDQDIFYIESDAKQHCTISRITGATVATIGDFDGVPTAMAADKSNVFVATSGALGGAAKVFSAPRLPGLKKELASFNGAGFAELKADGDQIFASGVVEKQQGLYRISKSGGAAPALLAPDVVPGISVSGGNVYFISAVDHALHRVAKTGGAASTIANISSAITDPLDLIVVDGVAYIPGKEPVERGGGGMIVRVSTP